MDILRARHGEKDVRAQHALARGGRGSSSPEPGASEPYPLPSDYKGDYLDGLQTQSGKYELIAESLKKIDDPDRLPLNRYIKSYEDPTRNPELAGFPLKL